MPLALSLSEVLGNTDGELHRLLDKRVEAPARQERNRQAKKQEVGGQEFSFLQAGQTLNFLVLASASNLRTATEPKEFKCRPSEKTPLSLENHAEDQRYEFVF